MFRRFRMLGVVGIMVIFLGACASHDEYSGGKGYFKPQFDAAAYQADDKRCGAKGARNAGSGSPGHYVPNNPYALIGALIGQSIVNVMDLEDGQARGYQDCMQEAGYSTVEVSDYHRQQLATARNRSDRAQIMEGLAKEYSYMPGSNKPTSYRAQSSAFARTQPTPAQAPMVQVNPAPSSNIPAGYGPPIYYGVDGQPVSAAPSAWGSTDQVFSTQEEPTNHRQPLW